MLCVVEKDLIEIVQRLIVPVFFFFTVPGFLSSLTSLHDSNQKFTKSLPRFGPRPHLMHTKLTTICCSFRFEKSQVFWERIWRHRMLSWKMAISSLSADQSREFLGPGCHPVEVTVPYGWPKNSWEISNCIHILTGPQENDDSCPRFRYHPVRSEVGRFVKRLRVLRTVRMMKLKKGHRKTSGRDKASSPKSEVDKVEDAANVT